jgi:hypothetical protein
VADHALPGYLGNTMSDSPRQLPPKKDVALALLEGPSVLVHLDPRREGVVVPKWFTGQPQLILQVGLNLPVPIPDLTVDDSGISCTLSFSRSPFWCSIPWSAVYALVGDDGRGMVWPNDVPPEVAAQMQKAAAPGKGAKKPRAKLAAVESREPREASEGEPGRAGARSRSQKEARSADQAAEPGASGGAEERRQEGAAERAPGAGTAERAPGAGTAERAPGVAERAPGAAERAPGFGAFAERAPARRNERGPRAPTPLSAAPQPPAQASPAEEKREADKEQRPRPVSPGDPKKPKRELPPYLRVIK